jgi:hypothetical protein
MKLPIDWPLAQCIQREYQAGKFTETFEEYAERLYGLRITYDEHGKNVIVLENEHKFLLAKLKFGV